MITLNDEQISAIEGILSSDDDFRNLLQNKFKEKAAEAEGMLAVFKNLSSIGGKAIVPVRTKEAPTRVTSRTATPVAEESEDEGEKTRGRPKSVAGDSTKIGSVLTYLLEHPSSSIEDIAAGLKKMKVEMSHAMLNSYLYKLNSRGDIRTTGERGSRVYTAKK